ncbi:MAG: alpha/beta hydrolase [Anaerolineales bacterium]|jgi:acetyl esterase/lipase
MSIQGKIIKRFIGILMSGWLKSKGIEDSRSAMEKLASHSITPSNISTIPLNIQGLKGEWIIPKVSHEDRVILYLHGGGYVQGSIRTHRDLIARICRAANARSLGINYRLAPENPFPTALEDTIKTYLWLLDEDIHPKNIILAGDSAGGGLAISAMVSLRDSGHPLPAGAVCLSPWTDLVSTGETIRTKVSSDPILTPDECRKYANLYSRDHDLKHPLISPLYAELNDLPPILIQVGTEEILLDDSVRIAKRLQDFEVEVTLEIWEEMVHVFQSFAVILPEGRKAIINIGNFIEKCLNTEESIK